MARIFSHVVRLAGAALLLSIITVGTARADYQSGLAAFDAGDYGKAFSEWQAGANQGDPRSEHGLGLLYDIGRGAPQDPRQAAEWYRKAADQGLTPSASNLALLYATGRGVPKDFGQAVKLWTFAAKNGYATAQFNLGLLYYRGDGVPRSYATAASWFLQAAQGGSDDGKYAIAEMYRLGRGVSKDPAKARFWFTESARAGNEAANDRLAEMGSSRVAAAPPSQPSAAAVVAPAPQPAPAPAIVAAPSASSGGSVALAPAQPPAVAPTTNRLTSMPNSQVTAMTGGGGDAGGVSLGLPLAPDASTNAPAPAGPAHIWIGTLRSDNDARLYWKQQVRRFPDLLQRLKLALQPVDLGAGQGVWYKVLAGPFAGADAAGRICQAIRSRAPANDCSVVTD